MPSVVEIKVVIDNEGAAQKVTEIEGALNSLGVNGTTNVRKLGEGLNELGGHTTTNLDKVRLLSQEFGLRLPRALESMIARSQQFMGVIAGLSTGIVGIGFAEVFVRGASAIYEAEQKYISIDAAANKFYETLRKTSELDFSNTRDLGTTQARLDQATQRMANDPRYAQSQQRSGFLSAASGLLTGNVGSIALGAGQLSGAKGAADDAATASGQMIELSKKQLDLQHDQTVAAINLAHAKDALLQVDQRANAEAQKKIQLDAEERSYNVKVQKNYGNVVPADAGAAEQQAKDDAALAEASVANTRANYERMLDITKSQNSAREAGLQGEALYAQKYRDELATLRLQLESEGKLNELTVRTAELKAKFDADQKARLQSLNEETARMVAESAQAGLSGAARILAERDAQVRAINDKQSTFSGGAQISPEAKNDFDQQRAAAANASYAKITELQEAFTQHARDLADQRAEAEMGAFGKIDAAAARSVADLKKTYDQDFAALSDSDEQKIAAAQALANAEAAINAKAASDKTELAARNRAEDAQYDREASAAEARVRSQGMTGWVSAHQQAVAAVEDQEQQRLLKLQEDAQKEGLTWQEVAQRRQDIERQTNAELAESNEQLAHTLAGQLQSAFDNPMRYIKQQGEKMMFELIAKWLMQIGLFRNASQGTLGGVFGGVGGASAGAAGLGGIFAGGGYRPSGTTGIAGGGLALPNGYSSSGLDAGTGGGYSSTVASPGSGAYGGTSSTAGAAPALRTGPGQSTSGTVGQISSTFGDARSLASQFGLGSAQMTALTGAARAGTLGTTALGSIAGGPSMAALSGAVSLAGTGLAGYQGAEGVLTAFHIGGLNGALQGTMSGAALGAAIGSVVPGLGTAIGGAIGAAAGLGTNLAGDALGESGRFAARDYYKKTLYAQLERLKDGSGADYLSAVSEANRDAAQGMEYMSQKWGQNAAQWVDDNYLKKELADVVVSIERRAASGAQFIGAAAKQFHSGGLIDGFGGLATSANEGLIHAMAGEGIVTQPAMAAHGAGVGLMNNGASPAEMAAHYLAVSGGGGTRSGGGGGDTHHWDVSALDAKSFQQMLDSGGIKVVSKSLNKLTGTYAGDGQVG